MEASPAATPANLAEQMEASPGLRDDHQGFHFSRDIAGDSSVEVYTVYIWDA